LFYLRKILIKKREERKNNKKIFLKKRVVSVLLFIILILFFSIFLYTFSYYEYITRFLPKIEDIQFDPPESSEIYDRNGNLIKTVYFVENRIMVPLSEVPENFINALIASEDERFYSHKGVDLKAILRAIIHIKALI